MQCDVHDCTAEALVSFWRVERRKIAGELAFCPAHADAFIHCDPDRERIVEELAHTLGGAVGIELDMLVYRASDDGPCIVFLRQIGGACRVGVTCGAFDLWNLKLILEGFPTTRPLTHHIMAAVLDAFECALQHVIIDSAAVVQDSPHCTAVVHDAQLAIRQHIRAYRVHVRACDAVVLAALCDAPLYIQMT